jgi:CYTH domain-containing protein
LDNSQIRIRKRSHIDGNNLYTLTSRTSGLDGQRIETRRSIPLQEYTILSSQCDPSHESIIKKRRCFLYEDQYFQLDIFQSPNKGLVLLEAYINDVHFGSSNLEASAKKCLPPFLVIEKEVTEDPNYSMFNLSKIIF